MKQQKKETRNISRIGEHQLVIVRTMSTNEEWSRTFMLLLHKWSSWWLFWYSLALFISLKWNVLISKEYCIFFLGNICIVKSECFHLKTASSALNNLSDDSINDVSNCAFRSAGYKQYICKYIITWEREFAKLFHHV